MRYGSKKGIYERETCREGARAMANDFQTKLACRMTRCDSESKKIASSERTFCEANRLLIGVLLLKLKREAYEERFHLNSTGIESHVFHI
jgi:hypothetical protein